MRRGEISVQVRHLCDRPGEHTRRVEPWHTHQLLSKSLIVFISRCLHKFGDKADLDLFRMITAAWPSRCYGRHLWSSRCFGLIRWQVDGLLLTQTTFPLAGLSLPLSVCLCLALCLYLSLSFCITFSDDFSLFHSMHAYIHTHISRQVYIYA